MRKPEALIRSDLANEAAYRKAEPDPLGDLHQRMKSVVRRGAEIELWKIDNDLWQAIHDLQTEVSFYEPASPPYGHRLIPR